MPKAACTTAERPRRSFFIYFQIVAIWTAKVRWWNSSFLLLFISHSALIENGGPMTIIRCMNNPAQRTQKGVRTALGISQGGQGYENRTEMFRRPGKDQGL